MKTPEELKQELLAKGKELGLHLGYNNKLEELADWWITIIEANQK